MKKIYLVATIVAILTGFATYFFAVKIQENSRIKDVPKTVVVVALVDIPQYTPISETMVGLQEIPTSYVVEGTALTLEEVVGKVALLPVVKGETVLTNRINAKDGGSALILAQELQAGEYAYTISVNTTSAVSHFIREGDYVNIYWDEGDGNGPKLALEKIRILKLSGYSENVSAKSSGTLVSSYSDVTLVLTKAQVLRVITAAQGGWDMDLVLISVEEGAAEAVKQVESGERLTTNPLITSAPTTNVAA